LAHEVWEAGGDLVWLRVAVAGGAGFQDVGDEDLLSGEADGLEHGVQELAGATYEGLASSVLFGARGFTDDQPVGLAVADAEDALGAGGVEGAFGAAEDFGL
jgi:hypothetical protein